MADQKHVSFLAIIVFSLGALGLFSSLIYKTELPPNSGGWFYEYQTFITGSLATFVAVLSLHSTWYKYLDNFKRKNLSARAYMSDALSEVCSYSKCCFWFIYKNEKINIPNQPYDYIDVLKGAIEFLDPSTSESVYELVTFYQVHNARLKSYVDNLNDPDSIRVLNAKDQRLYDAVKLYALAERLFVYARNKDKSGNEVDKVSNVSLSQEEMHSALNEIYGHYKIKMAINEADLSELFQVIKTEHGKYRG